MNDDKKPENKDPTKPLKNPEIGVRVTPKDEKSPEHKRQADEVKKKLKERIDKAIADNKSGGQEKQLGAVKDETKKAGQATDPNKIKEIKVTVRSTDEGGDKDAREWTVIPKESKPTP